ncbi:MAG: DUF4105 domain-containing protein [Polaribacter sp.]
MIKKYFFFFFTLAFFSTLQAQTVQLSVYSEISIVTVGPGEELYEAFGHSAIRIKDPVLNLDLVYNYGIFDFNQPNFYANFTKGNMIYSLASYDFKYFLASYKKQKRWVKQQVLNLTLEEKQHYFLFLEKNVLPANKDYHYDPYFDNCATKLRDITKSILGNKVVFIIDDANKGLTFRQLTNNEIHWNNWGSFGLNLFSGMKLDEIATTEAYQFLPDYVYQSFKNATLSGKNKLVKREDIILDFEEKEQKTAIFNPLLIFSILAILGIFITYKDYKKKKRTKFLDFLILFFTGLIGGILCFLWFFSNHSITPNNLNVLWAFFPNIIVVFLLSKNLKSKWMFYYLRILFVFILIVPVLWIFNIQSFPPVIIPLLVLLLVRYLYLFTYRKI